ncbi:MAG: hypothetical protein ACRYFX_19035 [Janthinobacterium lividum]
MPTLYTIIGKADHFLPFFAFLYFMLACVAFHGLREGYAGRFASLLVAVIWPLPLAAMALEIAFTATVDFFTGKD